MAMVMKNGIVLKLYGFPSERMNRIVNLFNLDIGPKSLGFLKTKSVTLPFVDVTYKSEISSK